MGGRITAIFPQSLINQGLQPSNFTVMPNLKDTQIAKAKPQEKLYRLYDGDGLHIAISPKGAKTWYFCYTHPITGKKNQSHKLGRYPALSLAQAREQAHACHKLLAQNIDPNDHAHAQKIKRQNKILIADYADYYLEFKATTSKPRTIKGDKQRIEKDIKPMLGKIALDELTKDHVKAMTDHIESRKKDDGTPPRDTTRKTLTLINSILKLAKLKGLIDIVVSDGLIEHYPIIKGNHFKFVGINNLPRLLQDIENYQGTRTHLQTKLGLKFLAYTFCRTQEMRFMRWRDIDWVEQVWNVDENTLKRNHAPHKVPLSKQVIEILEQLQPITGDCDFVFFNKTTMKPYSERFIINALNNMGYGGEQTGHGFRHIASTNLNELGYLGDAIEKQMHHKGNNTIRAIYNHAQHMDERRDIMQAWANFLDMLRDGERVSFRQARAMLDRQHQDENQQKLIDSLKQTGLSDEQIQVVLQTIIRQ